MDLNNLKLFKHLYQPIYDIIIVNNERYTQTYHQILINYSTLSDKSKQGISALFTTHTNESTMMIIALLLIVILILLLKCEYSISSIYYNIYLD